MVAKNNNSNNKYLYSKKHNFYTRYKYSVKGDKLNESWDGYELWINGTGKPNGTRTVLVETVKVSFGCEGVSIYPKLNQKGSPITSSGFVKIYTEETGS